MEEKKESDKKKWVEILTNTRENYLKTVKVVSDMQKEFEKVIVNLNVKSSDYRDETVNAVKDWIEKGNKIREDFQRIVEEGFKKTLILFPQQSDNPFKEQFERMYRRIEENLQKIFESFPISWMFKKK